MIVVDNSGSMEGNKINLVKEALQIMLKLMTPYDRVSIIQFNSEAKRLTPLLCITEQNNQYFTQTIQ